MSAEDSKVKAGQNFFNFHNHGFVRVAVGIPSLRVADPKSNGARTIELIREAATRHAVLVLFPELGLAGYSSDDLFHQRALLDGCLEALAQIVEASAALSIVSVVGMPLVIDHLLFNCAVVIQRGRVL